MTLPPRVTFQAATRDGACATTAVIGWMLPNACVHGARFLRNAYATVMADYFFFADVAFLPGACFFFAAVFAGRFGFAALRAVVAVFPAV
jgi:hypothetical protein